MALLDSYRQVRHLLRRAGFTMSKSSIDAYTAIYNGTAGSHDQKYEAVVDALLNVAYNPTDADEGSNGSLPGGLGLNTPHVQARANHLLTGGGPPTISSVPDSAYTEPRDNLHPAKSASSGGASVLGTFGSTAAFIQWWLLRCVYSSKPHLEKMTLFWHNHLTSNASTVNNTAYMAVQNDFFRRFAHGSFLDLLRGITRDAAMQRYLDNDSNVVTRQGRLDSNGAGWTYWEASNENYGRELLELFGLGVNSGYTEDDVKAVARALTGWGITTVNGTTQFRFRFSEHVSSQTNQPTALTGFPNRGPAGNQPFAFLGTSAVWGQILTSAGDSLMSYPYDPTTAPQPAHDVHQKIVDWRGYQPGSSNENPTGNPKAGEFIAEKLWMFFGGPLSALAPADKQAMVDAYRGSGAYTTGTYRIKGMLKTMFMSASFRSATSYRQLVKSPAEFVVGILRFLQAPGVFGSNAYALSTPTESSADQTDLRNMDQDLGYPPFPSGWDGFDYWINSTTWLTRINYVNTLMNDRSGPASTTNVTAATTDRFFNANAYVSQYGLTSWQQTIDHLLDYALDITPTTSPAGYSAWNNRLTSYLGGIAWSNTPDSSTSGSPSIQVKFRGLFYLVLSSPEYQLA